MVAKRGEHHRKDGGLGVSHHDDRVAIAIYWCLRRLLRATGRAAGSSDAVPDAVSFASVSAEVGNETAENDARGLG